MEKREKIIAALDKATRGLSHGCAGGVGIVWEVDDDDRAHPPKALVDALLKVVEDEYWRYRFAGQIAAAVNAADTVNYLDDDWDGSSNAEIVAHSVSLADALIAELRKERE